MIRYIIYRLLVAIPTLLAISIIGFGIIQLPEGDFLDRKIQELEEMYGDSSSLAQIEGLRDRYGLDEPMWKQYFTWISGFVVGDFGESFEYEQEVNRLIWDRLLFTIMIALGSLLFTYIVAIPVGQLLDAQSRACMHPIENIKGRAILIQSAPRAHNLTIS